MQRHEVIDARLEAKVVGCERIATFAPSASAMGQFCLALTLLELDLVSSVVFEASERHFLLVSVDRAIQPSVGSLVKWAPPKIHLKLSTNALQYWLAFALRYYRDGVGEVDHIDIDARPSPKADADTVLVFKVPSAKEALLPDQAKRQIRSFEE
jgi:hypothetical protein